MEIREHGKLGQDRSVEEGYTAARASDLTILASIKVEVGDLSRIKRVVRLFGMVNSTPDFKDHPKVIDGASDLYYELFGSVHGCHARSAVGMTGLPRGQVVEINAEFELII